MYNHGLRVAPHAVNVSTAGTYSRFPLVAMGIDSVGGDPAVHRWCRALIRPANSS
jgi:hypothetical protein